MKELSIEQKAQRYDEAIEIAMKINNEQQAQPFNVMTRVFPELKESKDEKIKKVIYGWIYTQPSQFFDSGFSKEEMLAWLEKQGNINPTEDELEALRMAAYEPTKNWSEKLQSLYEKLTHCEQKPVFETKTPEESLGIDSDTYNKIVDECIYGEQKPTDVEEVNFFDDFRKTDSEVEPKFHDGDWITNGDYTWQIVEIKPLDYILQSQDGNVVDDTISHVDKQFHSFTIQDAKAGDVLATEPIEGFHSPFVAIYKKQNKEDFGSYCFIGFDGKFYKGEDGHSTEEVHPATKEQCDTLTKAMANAGYTFDFDKKELKKIEQKPAWTEDDERIYSSIMYSFAHNYPLTIQQQEFVKSIKDKVQPQNTWKPSDEQMRILDLAIRCGINRGTTEETTLVSLFNDLKKLKE